MINRWLLLLLLLCPPVQAAQVISTACINEVGLYLEARTTWNPTDLKLYAWGRYIKQVQNTGIWGTWTVGVPQCLLWEMAPGGATTVGFPVSNVANTLGMRTVNNPINGVSFETNAIGIEQDQAGMDWCTG